MTSRRLLWAIAAAVLLVLAGGAAFVIAPDPAPPPPASFWVCGADTAPFDAPDGAPRGGFAYDRDAAEWVGLQVRRVPSARARLRERLGLGAPAAESWRVERCADAATASGTWHRYVRIELREPFEDDFPPDPALAGRWHRRTSRADDGEQVTLAPDGTMRVDLAGGRPPRASEAAGRWGARDGVLVLRWPAKVHRDPDIGVLTTDRGRADALVAGAWSVARIE